MSGVTRTAAMVLAAAISFSATSSVAQPTAASLEGVWKITNVVVTGANAASDSSPQPSLIIYSRGHYSFVSVGGTKPRVASAPAKDPLKLTDAEKLARFEEWNLFTANAGTYTATGTTVTMRPLVAKNVSVMTAPPTPTGFKLAGNSLVLTYKSLPGLPASERRLTLTRVR